VPNPAPPEAPRRLRDRLPFDVAALSTSPARRFFGGTLFGAMGTGLVLPFFVIYCVNVRHFPLVAANLILAWEAVLGLCIAPLYGTLVDRYGPSRILTITMPLAAVGLLALGFASTIWQLALIATFFSLVGAGGWSAFTVLLTRVFPEEHRADAFGINFWLLNIGIGLGVITGGILANVHDLRTFQALYFVAAGFSLANAIIWMTLRHLGGPLPAEVHEHLKDEGWREVLRDRRMLRFLGFGLVLMVCGYGSVEGGLPFYVLHVAHLSTHVVATLFAFNTLTIVVGQLIVLGSVRGRSRSLVLGAVGVCWGASWLFATSSVYVGALAAAVALCVGQVVFATGETLFQPTSGPLVNDLAPEHLRGRYNSLVGVLWSVSGAIGEVIAAVFLSLHLGVAWTLFLAAGAALGGLGMTTMRSVLTPGEDGREPMVQPAQSQPA
jgi:MFS family permease